MYAPSKELLLKHARDFLTSSSYRPQFTPLEQEALTPFFTNMDRRVFFIHSLPETVTDVILSMYSRLKNTRGIRGVFVDQFLPLFLGSTLQENSEKYDGNTERFLKACSIASLDAFVNHSKEAHEAFEEFRSAIRVDSRYIERFSSAPKVKKFAATYLDKYGHNSIARMAKLSLCFESISILAAKSIEWGRAGTGYIELSTRYVDMSGKEMYPIGQEIAEYGVDPKIVERVMDESFLHYRTLRGEQFCGPFPQFLREQYGHLFPDAKDLENGIVGETCDVLGNFLPCSTLTSVGVALSGEAFPELLKHLLLDRTPENEVLVEMILEEAEKIGGDQFARHFEPTEWKRASWEYLDTNEFLAAMRIRPETAFPESALTETALETKEAAERILHASFRKQPYFSATKTFEGVIERLTAIPRGDFDKLPNHFEEVGATLNGVMSFRSWRDLQRQQLCTHYRTYVTPSLGFYHYDKSAPEEFFRACHNIWKRNCALYRTMHTQGIPEELMQYPLAMGNLIGFQIGGNLAQMEFCTWQRTKFSVNHEVRKIFFEIERVLRENFPWWQKISRADITPKYIFARTKEGIPLR